MIKINPFKFKRNKLESEKKNNRQEFTETNQEALVKELEKIETVAEKLKENYSQYETLTSFIDHLANTEKIFIMAKSENSDFESIKNSFLNTETYLMSMESGIEEEIFNRIMDDFKNVSDSIASIYMTAGKLKKKYKGKGKCIDFIEYIKKSLITLWNIKKNPEIADVDIEGEKKIVLDERMRILSADGNPKLEKLKKIYSEFKNNLKKFLGRN